MTRFYFEVYLPSLKIYSYSSLLSAVVLTLVVVLVPYDGSESNSATFHDTILIFICRNSKHLGVDVKEQHVAGN
jgi:hypothetical protein